MTMTFTPFDKRGYPTRAVDAGYGEWAPTYEATVLDLMDLRLFERLSERASIDWGAPDRVVDLACGTGRIGAWLKRRGARAVDGVDLTPEMLTLAEEKGAYDALRQGDAGATGLDGGAYGVATMSLADEHIADLAPVYAEAARLLSVNGRFILVGFHPHFLMMGVPTHYENAKGEPTSIESYIHLTSDHVAAAHAAGFRLEDMTEGVVDDAWIAAKPKWEQYRNHPVSFAFAWTKS